MKKKSRDARFQEKIHRKLKISKWRSVFFVGVGAVFCDFDRYQWFETVLIPTGRIDIIEKLDERG